MMRIFKPSSTNHKAADGILFVLFFSKKIRHDISCKHVISQIFKYATFPYRADSTLFPVVSPSNRLIVNGTGITGDNVVNITVSAVYSGTGTYNRTCSYK